MGFFVFALALAILVQLKFGNAVELEVIEEGFEKRSTEMGEHGHDWEYENHGPSSWPKYFPKCGGNKQSPININTRSLKIYDGSKYISHNYKFSRQIRTYDIENNGHTLQIDIPSDTTYMVNKDGNSYKPMQVHIHFDVNTRRGSEHLVNGRHYFGELHIVHRNIKYSEDDSMKHSDGLLVVAIFLKVKRRMRWSRRDKKLRRAIKRIIRPGTKTLLRNFNIGWLIPKRKWHSGTPFYASYKGSLTTPPCSEIVDWNIIIGNTLKISKRFARILRRIQNSHWNTMSGNFRPVQPLNNRIVYGLD